MRTAVSTPGSDRFTGLLFQVKLNGKDTDALVDTGCGKTLVQWAKGLRLPTILQLYSWECEGIPYNPGEAASGR